MKRQKIIFGKIVNRRIFSRSFMIILLLMFQFFLLAALFLLLTQYIQYIYLFNLIVSFFLAVYVVNLPGNPESKIAWLTFMCLLPVFGIFYYLYFELNPKWHKNLLKVQKLIRDSAYLLAVNEKVFSRAERDIPENIGLLNFLQKRGPYPVYDENDVEYFSEGEKGFEAIKKALKNAQSYIFMEYFVVSPGKLLGEIVEILKEKAAAGIEVRFMYDGFCHTKTLPDDFPKQLEGLGIQVNVFEPLSPFLSTDQNNRDHRKITVVDGQVAFTGGFNLGDEYANFTHPLGHWKDVVVKLNGDAVKSFVVLYLQNWHFNGTKPVDIWADYFASNADKPLKKQYTGKKGFVAPYADSPNIPYEIGETVYLDILNRAKRYVWITTPYLILGSTMIKALTYASERGVDVRIIIPHIPDKKIPFLVAKSFYPDLIKAGIKVFEYTPGFIHAKIFVSDDYIATIGSFNMDYRSFYLNYEVGTWLNGCSAIKDISADFVATQKECHEIKLADYLSLSISSRIAGKVLRLFGPLL